MSTDGNRPNTATSFKSMLSLKSGIKSPYVLDLPPLGGETFEEEVFNTWVRNEGGTATATSPMICTPPEVTNPNLRDFANTLQEHTNVVSNLVQSVEGLTAAIKLMKDKKLFKGTCASMKAHNKKLMRYKDYVIKFLKSTKQKKATRGTLRRNLVKLESRFLSIVLKELIENKRIEKKGSTYALVQNDD